MSTTTIPDPNTYTLIPSDKSPQARRRVAQAWPCCADINDPRLGLTAEQLTATLEPMGLPAQWSEAQAAELATASWLFLSQLIGSTAALRRAVPKKLSVLLDIALTEIPGAAVPFGDFAAVHFGRDPWDGFTGYGGYATAFGRLRDNGPFRHLNAPRVGRNTRRTWELSHSTDYKPLDFAWEQAAASANASRDLLPVLDVRALCCFAPARRLVTLADGVSVHVPSAWEVAAIALAGGPDDFRARAHQLILHLSNPATVSARGGGYATTSVEGVQSAANGLIRASSDLSSMLSVLEPWADASRVRMAKSTRRRLVRPRPVVAPSVQRVRRCRAQLVRELERARKSRKPTSDWVRTSQHAILKKLLLLDLGAGAFLRAGEIARLRVGDVVAARDFADGVSCPAIFGEWSKSDGAVSDHWLPIRPETYQLITEWVSEWGLTSSDGPLFPRSALQPGEFALPADISAFFAGQGSRTPVLVDDAGKGFGEHSFRHLGEQLGVAVGRFWLEANPEWAEQLQPQVFADAANHHAFRSEVHAYKDLEQSREKWAFRALMGDKGRGVPGTLDLIFGDAGARKAWDVESIRDALSRSAAATELSELAKAERDESDATVAALHQELDHFVSLDVAVSVEHAVRELRMIKSLEIQERAAQEDRYQAQRRLSEAERMLLQARHDLEMICAAGRTVTLPDETPLAHEQLARGELVLETETFEAVLTRLQDTVSVKLVDCDALGSPDALLREREYLNYNEVAGVMDVAPKTFARWVDGSRRGPLSPAALRAAVVSVSSRRKFVAVDRMPADWWRGLGVAQREMVEQILRVPMGGTQFAGPSIEIGRIRGADVPHVKGETEAPS